MRDRERQEEDCARKERRPKSMVWHRKKEADGTEVASVNMVFVLPMEFKALSNEEVEQTMAQLSLDPMQATFEKPGDKERKHLRPLFMKGYINGKPITNMLVDGGAAVNLMPYITYRKLGFGEDDLIQTDMMLKDFEGAVSLARGAICVDLMIGSKTLPTTFFIINGKGSYSTLLGRDWIHANCCIPSTMHQCVVQWIGDSVEVINADSSFNIAMADLDIWSGQGIRCISG